MTAKIANVIFSVMIRKTGYLLLFSVSIIVIIAIMVIDIYDDPTLKLAYQFDNVMTEVEPPPTEISCDELYSAYLEDEMTADAKYKNKRLWFSNVEVTDVAAYYTLSGGELLPVKTSFCSKNIKFQLSNPYIMQNVEVGYILNIVGQCTGLSQNYVFIWDCWANSVVGDIGAVQDFAFGY